MLEKYRGIIIIISVIILLLKIYQRINLLRVGNRVSHLDSILTELEDSTYQLIKQLKDVGPEEIADHYILLARAVLTSSKDDATIYFEEAINIVSKFGDEIVQRWEAVAALGERAAPESSDELAYRFIRCTELVGEYVYREKTLESFRSTSYLYKKCRHKLEFPH